MAPPPPACRRPRSLPELMEELVEEILLRIPPDEPAHLIRAAVVSKPWRRILTDPGFLHRYRAFHRAPPLLGYLHNLDADRRARKRIPPLAPTSAPSPLPTQPPVKGTWWALDCRHGRVLIHGFTPYCLIVWDPITGGHKEFSLPEFDDTCYAGAVLCAVDGCDHLNCHDGPFLVVYAASGEDYNYSETWAAIYSSETGLWSDPIYLDDNHYTSLASKPSRLIGDTLYFSSDHGSFLKCDLGRHELSVIELLPGWLAYKAIAMEVDGGLRFVCAEDNCIYMWSWQGDANDGTGSWAHKVVMELETLLPTVKPPSCPHEVVALLEGTDTIFISVAGVGVFSLDLKSREVKNVGKDGPYYAILPYRSFYTPDLAKDTHRHLHEDALIDPLT